jgi:hypothetical protein
MTDAQAYKFGFLYRCAEEGLTVEETRARIKQAVAFVKQANPLQTAWNALTTLGTAGVAGTAALSAGAGALGGLSLAKLREPDVNPEEIRAQEEISAYNMYTSQIKQRNALRQLRQQMLKGRKPSFQF